MPDLDHGPSTIVGRMLVAITQRDNDGFKLWRTAMNEDEEAQSLLYPLLYEAFRLAVVRRFGPDVNAAELSTFLWTPRIFMWPKSGFDVHKAGALIRSALGEDVPVEDIPTEDVVMTRYQVLTYIVEDLGLSPSEICQLVVEAEEWVLENKIEQG